MLGGDGLLTRIREAMLRESLIPWFREWAAIEQEARALRSFQPLVFPGLLQTPAYARGMYEGVSTLAADDVERIVASRGGPPLFVAVLDQTVLERPVGGPKIMREQLLHLADIGSRLSH